MLRYLSILLCFNFRLPLLSIHRRICFNLRLPLLSIHRRLCLNFRYVDDPRNTDNSWMETVAFSFHDESGEKIGKFDLKAGDDAKDLKWMRLSRKLELYASHKNLLYKVAQLLGGHW